MQGISGRNAYIQENDFPAHDISQLISVATDKQCHKTFLSACQRRLGVIVRDGMNATMLLWSGYIKVFLSK